MAQSGLRLRDIKKSYGKVDVIHGVDLDIQPGEFAVFVGDADEEMARHLDRGEQLLEIRPDLPVVLCTGFSDRVNEGMLKGMGLRGLLLKPLTMPVCWESTDASTALVKGATAIAMPRAHTIGANQITQPVPGSGEDAGQNC